MGGGGECCHACVRPEREPHFIEKLDGVECVCIPRADEAETDDPRYT